MAATLLSMLGSFFHRTTNDPSSPPPHSGNPLSGLALPLPTENVFGLSAFPEKM